MTNTSKILFAAALVMSAFTACAGTGFLNSPSMNATDNCIAKKVRDTRRFSENSIGGTMVDLKKITPACVAENKGLEPNFYAGATVAPAPGK
jgi:hypothetical protein